MKRQVHIIIIGKVRGVGFRSEAQLKAIDLDITGWVRNIDYSVETIAQGEDEAIEEFIAFCRKGPEGSKVEEIELTEMPLTHEFNRFDIRY